MIHDCDEWVWDDEAFSAPLRGDGPEARRLTKAMRQVEVSGVKAGAVKPQHIASRVALVEARYRDWQKGRGG